MFANHPVYQSTFSKAWPKSHDPLARSITFLVMIGWPDDELSEDLDKTRPVF